MRRIIVALILIILPFVVFADGEEYELLGSDSKNITAFKSLATTNEVSGDAYVNLALFEGPSGDTGVYDGKDIGFSEDKRNTAYVAFRWKLTGTAFKSVSLEFSFGTMTLTTDSSKYIPYSVSVTTSDTTVSSGNTTITANSNNSTKTATRVGSNTRYFRYRDSITNQNGSKSVTTSAQTITVGYNMSTNTNVYTSSTGNTTVGNTEKNGITACLEWTRTGQASVTLNIKNSGNNVVYSSNTNTTVESGKYIANIVVTVTTGT